VFINVLLFQRGECISIYMPVEIPDLPDIRIGKGILGWVVIYRGAILVKFDGILIVILQIYDQAVVIERKIVVSIQAIAVYGIKIVGNPRLNPFSIGELRGIRKCKNGQSCIVPDGDP
jgi:hypothetical protein